MQRVIHMRTEHLGPDSLLVGAKIELESNLAVPDVASAIDGAENAVRTAVPSATVIYLEPDLHRTEAPR